MLFRSILKTLQGSWCSKS